MNSNFYSILRARRQMTPRLPTDHLLPPAPCPFPSQCHPIFSVIHFRQTPFCVNKTHTNIRTQTCTYTHTQRGVRCSKAAALFMLPTAVTTLWTKNETPPPVAWAGLSRCVHLSLSQRACVCVCVCVCHMLIVPSEAGEFQTRLAKIVKF